MERVPKFKEGDRVEADCYVLPLVIVEVELPWGNSGGEIWYHCMSESPKPDFDIFRESSLTLLPYD